jgi:hypothetical protein
MRHYEIGIKEASLKLAVAAVRQSVHATTLLYVVLEQLEYMDSALTCCQKQFGIAKHLQWCSSSSQCTQESHCISAAGA